MTSPFRAYLDRSVKVLRRNVDRVINANPTPSTSSGHLIYSLSRTQTPDLNLKDFATGCDEDIGGLSSCTLDLDEKGDGRFWGEMRVGVKREFEGRVRGGYAGFRNKNLPTMFGVLHHDLSLYTHLSLLIRPSGELATLRHWFINIQADGPVRSDLYQHRLPLAPSILSRKGYGEWQRVLVPLDGFVLTNSGMLSETQIPMMKSRVRTIGFSILGGGREPGSPGVNGVGTGAGVEESESGYRGKEDLLVEEDDLAPSARTSLDRSNSETLRPSVSSSSSSSSSSTSSQTSQSQLEKERGEHTVQNLTGIEGKFELGIREVRAVRIDEDAGEDPVV